MSWRLGSFLVISVTLCLLCLVPTLQAAAALTEVVSFGGNPGSLRMFIYKPASVPATNAPILVAPHYCRGDARSAQSWYKFDSLADKYGFIMIYPQSAKSLSCFEVSLPASLTHGGGGDALSIVNMVNTVIKTYSADKSRVFVAGFSSGANMANVLTEVYPDVFAAGAIFSGLLAGCVDPTATNTQYNTSCDSGKITKTGAEWATLIRAMYPGYTGRYPRMTLYHGDKDDMVSYVNFQEEVKAYAALLGVSETAEKTDANTPQSGWTRRRYGGSDDHAPLEATTVGGGAHPITFQPDAVIKFFGLDGSWLPTPVTETGDKCMTNNGGCDATNGVCSNGTAAKVTCACKSGYTTTDNGITCVKAVAADKCKTLNGGCDATNAVCSGGTATKVTCACIAGYTTSDSGVTCVKASGPCKSNPCANGACIESGNAYTCQCFTGYRGTNCDVAGPCQSSPCVNGVCTESSAGNSYTCQCSAGYSGTRCDQRSADACTAKPCGTHGTCVVSGATYKCNCQTGYTGQTCETADPCSEEPCGSHGTCVPKGGDAIECVCADGFTGTYCAIAPPTGDPKPRGCPGAATEESGVSRTVVIVFGAVVAVVVIIVIYILREGRSKVCSQTCNSNTVQNEQLHVPLQTGPYTSTSPYAPQPYPDGAFPTVPPQNRQ